MAPKPRLWLSGLSEVDDRLIADVPVARQRAGIGEQGIVAMHHAFRHAGRAGGEGEIEDAVRILRRRRRRCGRRGDDGRPAAGRILVESIDVPDRFDVSRLLEQIVARRIGAVAGFGDDRGRAHAL